MPERLSETALISRYFAPYIGECGKGLLDDTAFLPRLSATSRYAVSMDTMVEGVHIFSDSSASDWANRLLAANLSDLAAQSARPLGLLLSLSLPCAKAEGFIAEFAPTFAGGCRANELQWLGGDLTSSGAGICISASIFGAVKNGIDPCRTKARSGDALLVSGELGWSALGLSVLSLSAFDINKYNNNNNNIERAISRYKQPISRWREALKVGGLVNAMMDLSDGLLGDLRKLCHASGLGAEVWLSRLPAIDEIDEAAIGFSRGGEEGSGLSAALTFALTGGEDFELLMSAPLENVDAIGRLFSPTPITQIGVMSSDEGVRYLNAAGKEEKLSDSLRGYEHFTA